MQDLGHAIKKM